MNINFIYLILPLIINNKYMFNRTLLLYINPANKISDVKFTVNHAVYKLIIKS